MERERVIEARLVKKNIFDSIENNISKNERIIDSLEKKIAGNKKI